MILFGFDPGVHTGFCRVNVEGRRWTPVDAREMKPDQVFYWCFEEITAEDPYDEDVVVVCENYIINPKVYRYDHQGDHGLPLRLIGALQLTALSLDWKFVLQMPTVKPAGYGFLGSTYTRGAKGKHIQDSLAHVMYYLVKERVVDIEPSQKVQSITSQKKSGPRISRKVSEPVWHKPDKES